MKMKIVCEKWMPGIKEKGVKVSTTPTKLVKFGLNTNKKEGIRGDLSLLRKEESTLNSIWSSHSHSPLKLGLSSSWFHQVTLSEIKSLTLVFNIE